MTARTFWQRRKRPGCKWAKEKPEHCAWTVVPGILSVFVWSGVWVWGSECSLSVHMWACWVLGGRAMSPSAGRVTWTLSAEKVTDGTGSRGGGRGWSQWDSREGGDPGGGGSCREVGSPSRGAARLLLNSGQGWCEFAGIWSQGPGGHEIVF